MRLAAPELNFHARSVCAQFERARAHVLTNTRTFGAFSPSSLQQARSSAKGDVDEVLQRGRKL